MYIALNFFIDIQGIELTLKKLYDGKKQVKRAKNLTFTLQFSPLSDSFKLVHRAFCSGVITFLEIFLVPNLLI